MVSQSTDWHSTSANWAGPKTCVIRHCGNASQHFPSANWNYWSVDPSKKEILESRASRISLM